MAVLITKEGLESARPNKGSVLVGGRTHSQYFVIQKRSGRRGLEVLLKHFNETFWVSWDSDEGVVMVKDGIITSVEDLCDPRSSIVDL